MIYSNTIPDDYFSAENTLKLMEKDKERLVKNWGQSTYDDRLASLKEYIRNKKK